MCRLPLSIRWGFDPSKPSTFFDGPATYERLPAGYKIETVVSGLAQPTAIAFEPDGTMLVAQQSGAIRPGNNYGWPGYAMSVPLDQVAQPLLFYNHAIGPSGMEFYRGARLPAFDGVLFFCQFHEGGALHAVRFDVNGTVVSDNIMSTGCTSDVLTGPDGFLYFVDYLGGAVYRIARP